MSQHNLITVRLLNDELPHTEPISVNMKPCVLHALLVLACTCALLYPVTGSARDELKKWVEEANEQLRMYSLLAAQIVDEAYSNHLGRG